MRGAGSLTPTTPAPRPLPAATTSSTTTKKVPQQLLGTFLLALCRNFRDRRAFPTPRKASVPAPHAQISY
ncbi:hypothetical protein BIFGAL_04215 [Bifidobacterium gallicum DSM 20093 = LMG 11596]|uniref:Uncharacterized protein n=1 Tax=Bifidobacterium gallicum DSM 20093 = LMG 11596 TaxID=561180 RepID=D1NWG5_9BIFI|nr:hypothetical protein BIFGAL_04215 [Bifidobacterium gallicum DSM 20093 = LMG 11596]